MGRERNLYKNLKTFLNCKDYTVSGERYEVMKNERYDLLVTLPVPLHLEEYYKSKAYISHTDSKKTLLDKLYQSVKIYTLKKKLKLLNSFQSKEKKVLDIGAGTGDFLLVCNKNNWKTFGVEPNKEARGISLKKGILLKESIADFSGEKFDVITLWHVLEHVENLQEYITSLKKLLTTEGTLVVAVPNHKSFDALYYKEYWAAFDVPRHLWHFSQKSIKLLFESDFLDVVKTIPMKFDAFYVSLLSEKNKKGKINLLKAFYIGCKSNFKAMRTFEYSSLVYILKNR